MNYLKTNYPPDYLFRPPTQVVNEPISKSKNETSNLFPLILTFIIFAVVVYQLNQAFIPNKKNTNQYE